MAEPFWHVIWDPSVRPVAIGTAALGAVTGSVGTMAVIRQRSLQGDAVSHAALPGVALAYLLGARSDTGLILGAAVTGWLAMLIVTNLLRSTRQISFDAALAGALAVFFGLGLVLMTYIQRHIPGAAGFRVQKFLFGQDAALMRSEDLWPVLAIGGFAVTVLAVCWKEFKILSFDPEFAASLGFPIRRLDFLLTGLTVLAVVIGLQTVGVVLMSALIVAPAVAARQWTDQLGRVTFLAAGLGAAAGFTGTVLSHFLSQPNRTVPTGPTIVLIATALAIASILLSPRRGIITQFWSRRPLPELISEAKPT